MKFLIYTLIFSTAAPLAAQKITFAEKPAERKVDVLVDGKLFTAYIYPDTAVLKKPVLFPLISPGGNTLTRGFPLAPRAGERVDHPHHVGLWLNYENVNGFDYWNNSTAITPENRRKRYGTIVHTGVKKIKSGKKAILETTADWVDSDGKGTLTLREKTTYRFQATAGQRIIDRITTLTAVIDTDLGDVKDGMLAVRVDRALEHPATQPEVFTDAQGNPSAVPVMDNTGVSGSYRSSEGVEGDKVWSTRATWVSLRGILNGEKVSLAIIDHPQNLSYPTWWHARGYGLFAANPLGGKAFTGGKTTVGFKLSKGASVTFRYRVVITRDGASDDALNQLADDFKKNCCNK
jgi:Methane oxygenase PmoA